MAPSHKKNSLPSDFYDRHGREFIQVSYREMMQDRIRVIGTDVEINEEKEGEEEEGANKDDCDRQHPQTNGRNGRSTTGNETPFVWIPLPKSLEDYESKLTGANNKQVGEDLKDIFGVQRAAEVIKTVKQEKADAKLRMAAAKKREAAETKANEALLDREIESLERSARIGLIRYRENMVGTFRGVPDDVDVDATLKEERKQQQQQRRQRQQRQPKLKASGKPPRVPKAAAKTTVEILEVSASDSAPESECSPGDGNNKENVAEKSASEQSDSGNVSGSGSGDGSGSADEDENATTSLRRSRRNRRVALKLLVNQRPSVAR